MSDIDFDELDKAVNSLMGKAVVPKGEDDTAPVSTLSINSTLQTDEAPKYDALNKVVQEIGPESLNGDNGVISEKDLGPVNETARVVKLEPKLPENGALPSMPSPVAPAAKQPSSGRFMDVVHPSSDMRAAQPTPNSTPQLVGPVSPRPSTPPVATTASVAAPTPAPATPVVSPSTPSTAPVELAAASPFIADAKVEKRPLGGEPPTGSTVAPSASELSLDEALKLGSETAESEDDLVNVIKADRQQTLNAEDFSSETDRQERELLSIESAYDTGTSNQILRSVESGDTEKMLDDASKIVEKPGVIAHPTKQKSGWGVVVIIAVIIVLSIAVAGAAYFFVINKS